LSNPISGHNVTISSDQVGDVFGNNGAATNASGQVQITVSSGLAHTSTYTVTDDDEAVVLDDAPQVTFTIEEDTAPSNPTNFTGTAGDGQNSLSWTNPVANFSHIHIYRSTASGALGSLIADNILLRPESFK
jgi:hypothetical protein